MPVSMVCERMILSVNPVIDFAEVRVEEILGDWLVSEYHICYWLMD